MSSNEEDDEEEEEEEEEENDEVVEEKPKSTPLKPSAPEVSKGKGGGSSSLASNNNNNNNNKATGGGGMYKFTPIASASSNAKGGSSKTETAETSSNSSVSGVGVKKTSTFSRLFRFGNTSSSMSNNNPGEAAGTPSSNTLSVEELRDRKKKAGWSHTVFSDDITNLEKMSGNLQKMNKKGRWQTRFFKTNNAHLNYYSSEKSDKLRASINLREISEAKLDGRFGEFSIEMEDGIVYQFKAKNLATAEAWIENLLKRQDFFLDYDAKVEQKLKDVDQKLVYPSKEGVLCKKSPSRFRRWNECYFRLKDGSLFYYKSETSAIDDFLGEIVIDKSCTISSGEKANVAEEAHGGGDEHTKLDSSEKPLVLVITTKHHQFKLLAGSAEDCAKWINALVETKKISEELDSARNREKQKVDDQDPDDNHDPLNGSGGGGGRNSVEVELENGNDEDEELRELRRLNEIRSPPEWIKRWDLLSQSDKVISIQKSLAEKFQRARDVNSVVNAATNLIEELDDFARQTLPSAKSLKEVLTDTDSLNYSSPAERFANARLSTDSRRQARVDVFEFFLRYYHLRIVQEISVFVDGSLDNLSSQDMLRLMDLITAYNSKLNEILVGELGEYLRSKFPPFALMDSVDLMSKEYILRLKDTMQNWANNIIKGNTDRNAVLQRVQKKADGKLWTPGPVDLFNMFNEAMRMAIASGVNELQSSVITTSFDIIAAYLREIVDDLEKTKSSEFNYACAVANDCWSITEHLDSLEQTHASVVAFHNLLEKFDAIRKQCSDLATKSLNVVANMIVGDLSEPIELLFTEKHLRPATYQLVDPREDVMAVLLATIEDYFADLKTLLQYPLFVRATRATVAEFAIKYVHRAVEAHKSRRSTFSGKSDFISAYDTSRIASDRAKVMDLICTQFDRKRAEPLFKKELQIMDDLNSLLSSNGEFVTSTMNSIITREPYLPEHVSKLALMSIESRTTLDGPTLKEVRLEIQKAVESYTPPSTAPDKALLASNPYVRLFPDTKIREIVKKPDKPVRGGTRRSTSSSNAATTTTTTTTTTTDATSSTTKNTRTATEPDSLTSASSAGVINPYYPPVLEQPPAVQTVPTPTGISFKESFIPGISKIGGIFGTTKGLGDAQASSTPQTPDKRWSVPGFKETENIKLRGYLDWKWKNQTWKQRFFYLTLYPNPEKNDTPEFTLIRQKNLEGPIEAIYYISLIEKVETAAEIQQAAAQLAQQSEHEAQHDPTVVNAAVKGIEKINDFVSVAARTVKSKILNDSSDFDFRITFKSGYILELRAKSQVDLVMWVKDIRKATGKSKKSGSGKDKGKGGALKNMVQQVIEKNKTENEKASTSKPTNPEKKVTLDEKKVGTNKTKKITSESKPVTSITDSTASAAPVSIQYISSGKPKYAKNSPVCFIGSKEKDYEVSAGRVSGFQLDSKTGIFNYTISVIGGNEFVIPESRLFQSSNEIYEMYKLAFEQSGQVNKEARNVTPDYEKNEAHTNLADSAYIQAQVSLLKTLDIKELRKRCLDAGINTSELFQKSDIIRALAKYEQDLRQQKLDQEAIGLGGISESNNMKISSSPAKVAHESSQEEKEAIVRSLLHTAMSYVAEENFAEAVAIFEKASREAQALGNPGLEAKALGGLAEAYSGIPQMAPAAGHMFETAAELYQNAGDTSDRMTMLANAGDAYLRVGKNEDAIRCLAEHDDISEQNGGKRFYASKISSIQEQNKKKKGWFS